MITEIKVFYFINVNSIPECTSQADIAFMIDKSGSIQRDNFQLVLEFAKELVLQMARSGDPGIVNVDKQWWWCRKCGPSMSYNNQVIQE